MRELSLKQIDDAFWSGYIYQNERDLLIEQLKHKQLSNKQSEWMRKAKWRIQNQKVINDPYKQAKKFTVTANDLMEAICE
ncbi:hypothetical protein JCM19236_445 [Vibrio sp. JCM 19236]|nr:hypothetical protein JCM19236_445 [Vibrio sp. JCM 19236]